MSALGTAFGIVASKVRGRALARRLAATTPPITPVAVYFADSPSGLYQLQRWYKPLEALAAVHPTSIAVRALLPSRAGFPSPAR